MFAIGPSPNIGETRGRAQAVRFDERCISTRQGVVLSIIIVGRVEMKNLFVRFVREEEGQDLIEYALLAALISIVSIATLTPLGTAIAGAWTYITGQLPAPAF